VSVPQPIDALALGSWPGLTGPGMLGCRPDAITNCAIAATLIRTNNAMSMMRVGRRTAEG
jgi:hypothetical protein